MSDSRTKIKAITDKINKKYKSNTLTCGDDLANYEILPTPFASVNALIKGFPRGKFSTVAGPEHTGKGAFCNQLIAHHQAIDPNFTVMWSNFENSYDKDWAQKLGVDLDRIIFHEYTKEINTMERMMDIALEILKTEAIDLWIIDSIGAMVPKGDIYSGKEERSLEDANMLNLQRKLGEFYRKANVYVNKNSLTGYKGCAVIMIGQVYSAPTTSGVALEEVRGGNAVKHWAHLRLKFRRTPKSDWPKQINIAGLDGKTRKLYPGWSCNIKVDKTRINGNEGQELILPFFLGRGFDSIISTITAAMGLDIITRTGPYYNCSLLSEKVIGRDALMDIFTKDNNLLVKLGELVDKVSLEKGLVISDVTDTEPEETENNE